MKRKINLFFALFLGINAFPQVKYLDSVKILYDKKINIHKLFSTWGEWGEQMKKNTDKYYTEKFICYATPSESFYETDATYENPLAKNFWWLSGGDKKEIYSHFELNKTVSAKDMLETDFNISDSLRKIKWNITTDFKLIAGKKCRKAIGKIFDSVEVYAFYCEEIRSQCGPELIQGLPGAILGMAIPRMYTTWFATSVTPLKTGEKPIVPPTKGKKRTGAEIEKTINEYIEKNSWGKWRLYSLLQLLV